MPYPWRAQRIDPTLAGAIKLSIKSERERWYDRGLPHLAGGWLLAYRVIWCLLCLLAIAAMIQSYSDQRRYITTIREFYDTGLIPYLTNPGDQPIGQTLQLPGCWQGYRLGKNDLR